MLPMPLEPQELPRAIAVRVRLSGFCALCTGAGVAPPCTESRPSLIPAHHCLCTCHAHGLLSYDGNKGCRQAPAVRTADPRLWGHRVHMPGRDRPSKRAHTTAYFHLMEHAAWIVFFVMPSYGAQMVVMALPSDGAQIVVMALPSDGAQMVVMAVMALPSDGAQMVVMALPSDGAQTVVMALQLPSTGWAALQAVVVALQDLAMALSVQCSRTSALTQYSSSFPLLVGLALQVVVALQDLAMALSVQCLRASGLMQYSSSFPLLVGLALQVVVALQDLAMALSVQCSRASGLMQYSSSFPLLVGLALQVVVALSDLAVPSQGAQPTVYVPNERGVLMRASELVYNDAPWIAGDGAALCDAVVDFSNSMHVCARWRVWAGSWRQAVYMASRLFKTIGSDQVVGRLA